MSVNDYIDIANKIAGTQPTTAPQIDRSEQVNVGLDYAKRQAEKQTPEPNPIPAMGATPLAN